MKPLSYLFIAAAITYPAIAQEPLPPTVVEKTVVETNTPAGKVVEETVVEKTAPAPLPDYNPARQLSIAPRAVEVVPPGGTKTTETTETTTTRIGGRVYNTERNVVVVEGRELPYVTVPVLFVKETAELLDSESRAALNQTAEAIRTVIKSDPGAVFDIEGHTSTDGADDFNMTLSGQRAQRIFDELTRRYEIPRTALVAHGYGETYAKHPNGSEAEMTLDRRVLVVRSK